MNKSERHIVLAIDEKDYNILVELANERRLPISTYIRTIIVKSKEFSEMSDKLFEEYIEIERISKPIII